MPSITKCTTCAVSLVCVGDVVSEDKYSISSFLQCPDCGALWRQLDEADPGNRSHSFSCFYEGSRYQREIVTPKRRFMKEVSR